MNNIVSQDIWNYRIATYLNMHSYVIACDVFKIPLNDDVIRQLLFYHAKQKLKWSPKVKDGICCFPTCRHMRSFFIWHGDEKGTTQTSLYCRLHTKKFTHGLKHILYRFPSLKHHLLN